VLHGGQFFESTHARTHARIARKERRRALRSCSAMQRSRHHALPGNRVHDLPVALEVFALYWIVQESSGAAAMALRSTRSSLPRRARVSLH